MYSIVVAMILMLVLPIAAALLFGFIRSLRTGIDGSALGVYVEHDQAEGDDSVVLEFNVGPRTKKVTVERIIIDRDFAARVLAQTPAGFRSRTPAAPPEYSAFQPDLEALYERYKHVTTGMIAREKRRQYDDVLAAWEDLKTSVVIWEGGLVVRSGHPVRLVVPMRTDVAASGRFTFIYSYRRGLFTGSATAVAEYRPRLIALHG